MKALTVARKDFKDTRRTKTLWIVAFLLFFLGSLMAYVFDGGSSLGSATDRFERAFLSIAQVTSIIVPIVAIVATYLAIAGERERGSIKFLLSLPNTRRQVFAGKLASRVLVVALSLAGMFGLAAAILSFRHSVFSAGFVVGVSAVTICYALTFVSISLALSAAVATRTRAIAGAVTAYFGLVVFYIFPVASIVDIVNWVHDSLLGLGQNWDLYNLVEFTSPFVAFQKGLNLVVPEQMHTRPFVRSRAEESLTQSDLPLYLQDEFALAIFAFWIVIPLLVGFWRFKRVDLK
jgi:ABC-2 type transport system permease protein